MHDAHRTASFPSRALRCFVVCAALAAAGPATAAPPADENFESYAGDAGTVSTPRTLGGFDYVLDGGGTTYIADSGSFGLTVTSGNTLVMNADAANNVRNMEIRASSLADNFKLDSLKLESFGGTSSVQFTVTGYDGGSGTTALVTETIDVTTSSTGTTISYAKNASVDGGTLTFGPAWQSIDTILFNATDGTGLYLAIDDILISTAVAGPALSNLAGDSVAWAGVGSTVTLDAGGNATAADADFDALNGGNGDWAGGSLTVQRSGTAISSDVIAFDTTGALFSVSGANLQSGGLTFATYTSTGGVLTVTFTSSGTAATTALVNDVLRRVTYRNDTPAGDAAVRFTLSDGTISATADVTVTSDTIYITNTTDTATINVADGVSISEAVAIAAADATGSQTLVFTSAFNSTVSLAGGLAVNESLTLDAGAASGTTISGSTITITGGQTVTLSNGSGNTFTIASTLSGAGSLAKTGAGTLALSNTGNSGGWSGGVSVAGGTLQVDGSGAVSPDSKLGSGTITLDSGTLASTMTGASTSQTIDNAVVLGSSGGTVSVIGGSGLNTIVLSGTMSGAGGLTKAGASRLSLTGNNSYAGATAVNAGTLIAGHANALGATGSGTTVSTSGTLDIAGGITLAAEPLSIAGTGAAPGAVPVSQGALRVSSGTALVAGIVTLTGAADVSAASGATLTISGALAGGAFALNKTDAGTLTLSNSGNEAGLIAGTTATAGTLSVANDDHLPAGTITLDGGILAITGATTIDNAVTLASASTVSNSANATLSGVLGGTGALTKSGAGTLALSGTNTHSGAVGLTAGGLTLSGGAALGDTSAVTLSAGTTLTVSAAETIGSLAGTGASSVVLNAGLTAGGDNTSTSYPGVISGTSGLTKAGSGTLTLTGNNSYTGATNVSAGGLTANRSGGALNDNTSVSVASGATLTVAANETIDGLSGAGTVALGTSALVIGINGSSTTFSGDVTGSGTLTLDGGGTFTLSGSDSGQSWAMQVLSGGTVSIAGDGNLGSGTLVLSDGTLAITSAANVDNPITLGASSGRVSVGSGLTVTLSGTLGGSGGLTKTGAGTLALSASNGYMGSTTVSAGTLQVTGALTATSALSVSSGAVLAGSGAVTTTTGVSIGNGATLSPGVAGVNSGIGSLTINGPLSLGSGGILQASIAGTTAGTNYDQVAVNGTLALNSGPSLSVTHSYSAGLGDSYVLIANDGADAVTGTFSGLAEGATVTAGGNGTELTASYAGGSNGNDFTLTAPSNSSPVTTNLDGDTAAYTAGSTVALDIGGDATVSDAQNDGANWDGGNVTVQRVTAGGADPAANDVYGFAAGAPFTVDGADLEFGGTPFASFTSTGGVLSIGFSGAAATTARVQEVVRAITYRNDAPYGDAVLRVSINDGASGSVDADVTLTSAAIHADLTDDDGDGDAFDGYSLREAFMRGVAQAGADTIVVQVASPAAVTFGSAVTAGAGDTLDVGAVDLTLGGADIAMAGALTIDVDLGGVAAVNPTLTGTGTLTKSGAGVMSLLSAGNEAGFSGGIVLAGGTLNIGSDDALSSGTLTLSGGRLNVGSTPTIDNPIAVGSGSVLVDIGNTATLSGVLSGTGTLTKTGSGRLLLTNPANSTSTWGATLHLGALAIDAANQLGTGTLTVDGGSLEIAAASAITLPQALAVAGAGSIDATASGTGTVITLTGAGSGNGTLALDAGDSLLQLSQASGLTGSLIVSSSGAGMVAAVGSGTFGSGLIQLNAGSTLGVAGDSRTLPNPIVLAGDAALRTGVPSAAAGVVMFSGAISETGGARALTLNAHPAGSNALALSGTSTYSGATTVASGVVVVDGALSATSALDVDAGTLRGNGSIFANGSSNTLTVDSGARLAPGSSPGTLTVNGDLVLATGSALDVEIAGDVAGTGYDRLVVGGAVSVGGATLNVTHGYAGAAGDAYTIIDRTSAGTTTGTFAGLAEGTGFAAGGNATPLSISYAGGTGNDVVLTAPMQMVTGVSSTTADGTYATGASIAITVTFGSAVTVTGAPTLQLETGTTDRFATYAGGSGTNTLTFAYTVQSGDSSADLDYTSTSALALNGGTIDAFGSPAALTLPAPGAAGSLGANKALVIDAQGPGVLSVQVPADGRYGVGALLNFVVTFDAAVDVTTSNLRIPVTLDTGGTAYATYFDGHGTTALTFRMTVAAGQNDLTGIALGTAIDLNGGALRDSGGNDAALALNGAGSTAGVLVDTTVPTAVSLVRANPSPTNAAQAAYTLTFDEVVANVDAGDFTATFAGGASGTVAGVTTSDNIVYTVTVGSLAGSGTLQLALNGSGTGIVDVAANAIAAGFAGETYALDRTSPAVTSVGVPAADTYLTGEALDFAVAFDEAVTVTGAPRIAVTVDTGGPAFATYLAGGGTASLTFRMIVATGQVDIDGIALGAAIDANGGTLRDALGNDASTALNGVGNTSGVLIDGTAPGIVSVAVPAAGRYNAGDVLAFTVNASEAITVDTAGGTPRLALTIGSTTVYAAYASGSGSSALLFQYTVLAGQDDADGIAVNALEANGGTLRDGSGNALALALAGVGATGGVIVDNTAPTATSMVRADPSPSAATQLRYTLTFSEDVTGVDAADFAPVFTGGAAGTLGGVAAVDARTYTITVASLTGNGTLQLALNGSSNGIADLAGNALGAGIAGETYTLDRTPSSVGSVGVPPNGVYGPGSNLDFTITFEEPVTIGVPPPTLTLNIGGRNVQATYVSGTGTNTIVLRYVVQPTDSDLDGIVVVGFAPGGLTDVAGNPIPGNTLPPIPPTSGVGVNGGVAVPAVLVPAGDWLAWLLTVVGVMVLAAHARRSRA